jgi:hypothetical protein
MGGDPISLNQRVQGSSPCAPTIEIVEKAYKISLKIDVATVSVYLRTPSGPDQELRWVSCQTLGEAFTRSPVRTRAIDVRQPLPIRPS